MDDRQVADIFERRAFPGLAEPARLVSTHISWVILTPEYAFKIKKPVRFNFLDFSTPELRAHFCREEVRLNRRLAPQTYLGVLPIGLENGLLRIGARGKPPADFAVWMRREDNSRELDALLRAGTVTAQDMKKLAHKLAAFHRANSLKRGRVDTEALRDDFADLFQQETALVSMLGPGVRPALRVMQAELPVFIAMHAARFRARAREGFRVDGHGDLHTRNIFLTDDPVLFDCIEFNPHMRRLDVLDELAFLAMDLDYYRRPDLAEAFVRYYQEENPCIAGPEDELLFRFFKAYRANVRLKVTLLSGKNTSAEKEASGRYWALLTEYWSAVGRP